jgi:hypothetical protein
MICRRPSGVLTSTSVSQMLFCRGNKVGMAGPEADSSQRVRRRGTFPCCWARTHCVPQQDCGPQRIGGVLGSSLFYEPPSMVS